MVLEFDVPSKPRALRMGEEALTTFPRLYLDADVVLSGQQPSSCWISSATDQLSRRGRPSPTRLTARSCPVRRYYKRGETSCRRS